MQAIARFSRQFPRQRRLLLHGIWRVWECRSVKPLLRKFSEGDHQRLWAERILGMVRWLFIEQDITYWATSGRAMLRKGFEAKFGPLP